MMLSEFKLLSDMNVSAKLYNDVIEPLYNECALNKDKFCELIKMMGLPEKPENKTYYWMKKHDCGPIIVLDLVHVEPAKDYGYIHVPETRGYKIVERCHDKQHAFYKYGLEEYNRVETNFVIVTED